MTVVGSLIMNATSGIFAISGPPPPSLLSKRTRITITTSRAPYQPHPCGTITFIRCEGQVALMAVVAKGAGDPMEDHAIPNGPAVAVRAVLVDLEPRLTRALESVADLRGVALGDLIVQALKEWLISATKPTDLQVQQIRAVPSRRTV